MRKRDINDWILWLMVFRIYMDKHDWLSVVLCLALAVVLYLASEALDKRFERWKNED